MSPGAGLSGDTCGKALKPKCSREDLQIVLTTFFDIMCPVGLIFGGIGLIASVIRSINHGWYSTLFLHSGMYLAAVVFLLIRRRLPVMVLFFVMFGLIVVSVLHSLFKMGLAGEALMSLTFLCVFAGVFLRARAGTVSLCFGLLTLSVFGTAICTGMIPMTADIAVHLSSPATWITEGSLFLLYSITLMFTVSRMQERTIKSLTGLREMNEQLQSEIALRKTAEAELRESELKYRGIFEGAVEGIFQISPEWKILNLNTALLRMAGFTSAQNMRDNVGNFVEDLFLNPVDGVHFKTLLEEQGFVTNYEVRARRRDGNVFWISLNARAVYGEDGRVLHFEGTMENISKRKFAEIALQESEAKYRAVVESSLVVSYIIQDNLFRFVNKRFCDLSGYSYEEVVDRMGPLDLVHPDERGRIQTSLAERIKGKSANTEYELRVVRKDGDVLTVKLLGSHFMYNGCPAAFGTLIDITKEKSLESQLRQSQKMEAIGTLAGGIAHDFNNIITALIGFGSLLQKKLETTSPLRHYASQILSASDKAARLTQSLLAFGRCQPIALKPQKIDSIIQGTQKLLRRLITEDISLSTNLNAEDTVIMADSSQIDQILFNLVTNARDAMPRGGNLKILTERVNLDKEFVSFHGFGEIGTYLRLSVEDMGVGMDQKTKEKIFDPFFTTKEVGKGTGLGLSTVYGIVKQHNGYIVVDSRPGQGTVVSIYFPTVESLINESRVEKESARGGQGTILVAEDDEDVRSFISEILNEYGYTVIEAVDGDDALDKFKENENISLVILDSIMPNRNGMETHDALKEIRTDVRTLFISGYAADVILDKGIKEQDLDFVSKPLSPVDFLNKIKEVLSKPIQVPQPLVPIDAETDT